MNPDDTEQWYFQTKKWIDSSPAVSKEGNMYFGSNDGSLYALSSSGILLWTFTTNGVITLSPAIGSDRTLYFGSNDGNLYAIGEKKQ